MAFIVYFFVVLTLAGSVLFGLDWVNAPLRSPVEHAKARIATTGVRTGPEHTAPHRSAAANASAAAQRAMVAASVGRHQPASRPEPAAAPMDAAALATEAVATGAPAAAEQPQTEALAAQPVSSVSDEPPVPLPPRRPEMADAVAAAPQAATDQVAEEKPKAPAETPERAANAAAPPAQPKHATTSRSSSRIAKTTPPASHRNSTPRWSERKPPTDVPNWAVRGARAVAREAREQRQAPVPVWAVRAAAELEADRRDAPPVREAYPPFWTAGQGWDVR
jgi:hypothetical protein